MTVRDGGSPAAAEEPPIVSPILVTRSSLAEVQPPEPNPLTGKPMTTTERFYAYYNIGGAADRW
ncbi:MAG: hypothetical protein ABI407_15820 [Bradyrhizobium sp.]